MTDRFRRARAFIKKAAPAPFLVAQRLAALTAKGEAQAGSLKASKRLEACNRLQKCNRLRYSGARVLTGLAPHLQDATLYYLNRRARTHPLRLSYLAPTVVG